MRSKDKQTLQQENFSGNLFNSAVKQLNHFPLIKKKKEKKVEKKTF